MDSIGFGRRSEKEGGMGGEPVQVAQAICYQMNIQILGFGASSERPNGIGIWKESTAAVHWTGPVKWLF